MDISKKYKVKLVVPPAIYFCDYFRNIRLPYGIGVITSFLKGNGINVNIQDLSVEIEFHNKQVGFLSSKRIDLRILLRDSEIVKYILYNRRNKEIDIFIDKVFHFFLSDISEYNLIGFSVMGYTQFLTASLLAKKIELDNPKTKIVLGGPFITGYGELLSKIYNNKFMILGQGEKPLLKLIQFLREEIEVDNVPNLIYKDDNSIKVTPCQSFLIENMALPDFSDLYIDNYKTKNGELYFPYQVTRGCTQKCSFCHRSVLHPKTEFKSYTKVLTELREIKRKYQPNYLFFCDEAINCSYDYLDELCSLFIKENLNIKWLACAIPRSLDKYILKKMKKAGCISLIFGVESGSNRILKSMGKGFTVEEAEKVLRLSYRSGIKNRVFILIGYPTENRYDLNDTIRFVKKNAKHINILQIASFRLEYGTPLYKFPMKFGIKNIRLFRKLKYRKEFMYFAFDETDGLRWRQKIKQIEKFNHKLFWVWFFILIKRLRLRYLINYDYKVLGKGKNVIYKYLFIVLIFKIYLFLRKSLKHICSR